MGIEEMVAKPGPVAGASAEFSRFEHATVGTLYMIFGIGGVATNLLLLLTLLKDKTLLRGSTSWLHISLALANIGVVAPSPFPASSSFSGKWLYGDKLCQAYAFEGMFVGLAAIGSVVSLCVERYVMTTRKEAMQQNPSAFYWLTTSINVTNALFWAVMPILGWSRYSVDTTGATCALDWKTADEGYKSYLTMLFIFSFGIPVFIALIALYKAIPDATAAPTAGPSTSGAASGSSSGQDGASSSFSETQLRWLCLTFVVLVVAGWGPFALLCVWAMVGNTEGVSMLAACLPPLACKMFTMLYPLAYSVANARFRTQYLSVLGAASDHTASKAD